MHRTLLVCALVVVQVATSVGALSSNKIIKLEKKLLACDVCTIAVTQLMALPGVKDEDGLLELTGKLCDPSTDPGAVWSSIDIEYGATELKVINNFPEVQVCNDECRRAAKSCDTLIEEHEDDIAEAVANGMKEEALIQKVCYKWTKSCAAVKLPVGFHFHSKDVRFHALSVTGIAKVKQLQNFRRMQAKSDMGLGAQIDRMEEELNSGVGTLFVDHDGTIAEAAAKAKQAEL